MASQATLTGAFAEELVFAMNDLSSTVGLMRREFRLEFGKVGASLMDDHHLAVDDGFAWYGERAGNLGKALGPIKAVAGEHLLSPAVEVDLDAIAIVLDFMKPLLPPGGLGL